MSEEKKIVPSPQKEALECRMKRVEIIGKIEEIKADKVKDELTIQRMKMENEEIKMRGTAWNTPLDQLMGVARAWYIDNEKTVIGSEPAIRSLWNEEELEEIKFMIMKKVRKL